jgi:hypothetical protein
LTRNVDGRRVIVDDPPLIQHIEIPGGPDAMRTVFEDYRWTTASVIGAVLAFAGNYLALTASHRR